MVYDLTKIIEKDSCKLANQQSKLIRSEMHTHKVNETDAYLKWASLIFRFSFDLINKEKWLCFADTIYIFYDLLIPM